MLFSDKFQNNPELQAMIQRYEQSGDFDKYCAIGWMIITGIEKGQSVEAIELQIIAHIRNCNTIREAAEITTRAELRALGYLI